MGSPCPETRLAPSNLYRRVDGVFTPCADVHDDSTFMPLFDLTHYPCSLLTWKRLRFKQETQQSHTIRAAWPLIPLSPSIFHEAHGDRNLIFIMPRAKFTMQPFEIELRVLES